MNVEQTVDSAEFDFALLSLDLDLWPVKITGKNIKIRNTYTLMHTTENHHNTMSDLSPANVGRRCWKLLQNFRRNVFKEPLETAALVSFFKRQLFAYITDWIATNSWLASVKVFSVLRIKPNLNNPHVVLQHINVILLQSARLKISNYLMKLTRKFS